MGVVELPAPLDSLSLLKVGVSAPLRAAKEPVEAIKEPMLEAKEPRRWGGWCCGAGRGCWVEGRAEERAGEFGLKKEPAR